MRPLRFIVRSLVRGLRWLHALLGWWLVPIGTLALVGVVIVFQVADLPTWLVVQVATLIVVAVFMAGAYRVWDDTDRQLTTAAQTVGSPNPLTVLTWNGSDYVPAAAKAWSGPKMFIGGDDAPDPATVPGVATNPNDTWTGFMTAPDAD